MLKPAAVCYWPMKQFPVAEILELPVAERIRLVELIWNSIAAVPEAVTVSDELQAELNQRLAEFEANPEAGSPWEEVRKRIVQGADVPASCLGPGGTRDR